jgi:hypothetical protein
MVLLKSGERFLGIRLGYRVLAKLLAHLKQASLLVGLTAGVSIVSIFAVFGKSSSLRSIDVKVESEREKCWQGENVRHKVKLKNNLRRPQVVDRFLASCGCSTIEMDGQQANGPVEIPALGSIELDVTVQTAGRIGMFVPTVGYQLKGQRVQSAEYFRLPVYVLREINLVPSSIRFSFDESSDPNRAVSTLVELSDNVGDGQSTIIVKENAKFEVAIKSNRFDRVGGDNMRNHCSVSVTTFGSHWQERSASDYLEFTITPESSEKSLAKTIRLPVFVSFDRLVTTSPKSVCVEINNKEPLKERIAFLSRGEKVTLSIVRMPSFVEGVFTEEGGISVCELTIDLRGTSESTEIMSFMVNDRQIDVPLVILK